MEKELDKSDAGVIAPGMYEALKPLPIYDKAEKGRKQKKVREVSAAFRANKGQSATMALASYDKGDKFSVLKVQIVGSETYGETPSGHVCLAGRKGRNCKASS